MSSSCGYTERLSESMARFDHSRVGRCKSISSSYTKTARNYPEPVRFQEDGVFGQSGAILVHENTKLTPGSMYRPDNVTEISKILFFGYKNSMISQISKRTEIMSKKNIDSFGVYMCIMSGITEDNQMSTSLGELKSGSQIVAGLCDY